jgi:hypothetical protein
MIFRLFFGLCDVLTGCQTIFDDVFDFCGILLTIFFLKSRAPRLFPECYQQYFHSSIEEINHLIELRVVLLSEYIFTNRNNFSNDDNILRMSS